MNLSNPVNQFARMGDVRDYLTAQEAAVRLGVTHSLICRWIKKGKIEAEKLGRTYAIKEAEIERFAKEPRQVGRPKERTDVG